MSIHLYMPIGALIGGVLGAVALVLFAGWDAPGVAWAKTIGYFAMAGLIVAGLLSFDAGRKRS